MISLVIKAVGGLGLFILGMTMMSAGLKMAAGKRIKKILSAVSYNRIIGCLTGAGITALIQSSSATTVILVGFVSAGLISLQQAIGMILGANIGTTMTAQLIAFNLSNAAMPAIAIGVAMKLLIRKKQAKYWGEVILGFGLVFFGMTVMKSGLAPMKTNATFLNFLTAFSPDTTAGLLLSVLAGAVLTIAVQSSSATIGLTMVMASQSLITFPGSIALVLGENIGTTITAELATIGSHNINAVRTARAHTMFNVIGVTIILIIFPFFIDAIIFITEFLGAGPVYQTTNNGEMININRYIANGHTIFNVLNAIFFLFALKWLVKVATFISPKIEEEDLYRLPNFDNRRVDDIPIALMAEVRSEILRMAKTVKQTFIKTTNQIQERNYKKLLKWKNIETHIDDMQKEIISCLVRLFQSSIGKSESKEISNLMRMTNNLERIGDSIESIAYAVESMIDEKIKFTPAALTDLNQITQKVLSFIELIIKGIKNDNLENFEKKASETEKAIDDMRERMRQEHIRRIKSCDCGFEQGLVYIGILTNLEKIGDYCFNISNAVTDKK